MQTQQDAEGEKPSPYRHRVPREFAVSHERQCWTKHFRLLLRRTRRYFPEGSRLQRDLGIGRRLLQPVLDGRNPLSDDMEQNWKERIQRPQLREP